MRCSHEKYLRSLSVPRNSELREINNVEMKPVKFVIDTAASPVKHVPNLLAERGNSLPTVEAKYTRCRKDETGIMVLLPVSSKYGLSEYLFLIIIIIFFIQ